MKALLKAARIIAPQSTFHNTQQDVLIENGIIASIGSNLEATENTELIDARGCLLSIGWFDLQAQMRDPGFEHKEDLQTGCKTASAGGFTHVMVMPNTEPAIDSKGMVEYIGRENRFRLVQLFSQAAVTKGTKGQDFTDMVDLHQAGALAFGDGETEKYNSDITLKTLQYLQKVDGLLVTAPQDKYLSMFGQMHEGVQSTLMGTKAIPSISEEICVDRDLKLLEYAGGKIHFSNLSTKEAVEAIRKAKKSGLQVSCDVAANQLHFTDSDLSLFDTRLKVMPPYRSLDDSEALKNGLADGTIDAVVSAHAPHDEESKKLEFDLADFGSANLQTVYPVLAQHLDAETIVEKLAYAPRRILKQEIPEIEAGASACLTLFDPAQKWTLNAETNHSKSVYSPFWERELTGKVKAVFNNGFCEQF